MWNPISDPSFDAAVRSLSRRIGITVAEIQRVLQAVDIASLSPAEQRKLVREVNALLNALDTNMVGWVDKTVDASYAEGRARVLVNLGVARTTGHALEILRDQPVSRVHRAFINGITENFAGDLLKATHNTREQVKQAVRAAYAEALLEGSRNHSGRRTISADAMRKIRASLGESADFAIRDSLDRVWKLETYADMVTRSKLVEAHRNGVRNEAIERGAYYGVVSSHGTPCPKCSPWEGRILKLVNDAPGAYPTVDEARSSGLWHPQCEHGINVVRDPNLLPESVRKKGER